MVARFPKPLIEALKIGVIFAWLMVAGGGFVFHSNEQAKEMFAYSFIIPILMASFFYGQPGGLLVALASSLISGSLAIGQPDLLYSPVVQRVLFQVIFFNVVALVTSILAERQKAITYENACLYRESLDLLSNLQKARDELMRLNTQLERKVNERTSELARRVEQLDLISRVGRNATVLDRASLLPQIAQLIGHTLGYYAVSILLADPAAQKVYLSAVFTVQANLLEGGLRLPIDSHSIIGHVALTGEPLVVNDVSAEPRYRPDARLPRTRAELALPLRIGAEVLGVLDLESAELDVFSADDVQVLQTLADQIAVIIHNARLYQAEAEARRAADTLREVGQVVGSTLNLDEVLNRILSSLSEVLPYDSATIMLLKGDTLYIQAGRGFDQTIQGVCLPLAVFPLNRQVVGAAQPMIISDVRAFAEWPKDKTPGADVICSWIGAPLIASGQVIGMLTIDNYHPGAYTERNLPMVMAFANQAAIALRNAELFQAAQTARAEAEEANRLKSQFLANMSHELRTPLNSVINFAYLLGLGTEGPLTPGQEDLLNRIGEAGRHLLGLINDILDLAKIEAGRLELFIEDVDLQELITGVLSTSVGLLRGKPVELKREVPADLPLVKADRTRVRQVLLNLLSNAAKFTDAGSITVRAWADDEWVTLSVTDTGIGMKGEDVPKAFAEFVQLDGTLKRQAGGTGLGLPISKRFVEMHGGRLWAESELGKGSTFYFTLPCVPKPVPVEVVDEPTEARVLVIDDDAAAREVIARQLAHGYQVIKLSDSRKAVERIKAEKPDVIVLDVMMPYQDGWDILKALKADKETRDIPVVVCSMLREQALAMTLGAGEYLVKPVERDELRRVVEQFAPPGGKVLAVDDDPNALEIVRRMLDGTSYKVSTAQDGWSGLAAVRAQAPDVVVLDLMMPGLSGFEVLADLRADPRTAGVPVVIVTAKELTGEERAQLQSAAAALLQKGQFTPEEFVNTVRRAVTRAAHSQEVSTLANLKKEQ
jgi:signal transduction histidine kinase/CheY-like chemotaxis protein